MEKTNTELLVLGAGPGGYVAAIRGAQLGLETTIIEQADVGGVCLNWGCIPSKALIEASSTLHRLRHEAPAMGIRGVEEATVDRAALAAWKDGIVKKLTSGVRTLLKGNRVHLVAGRGRLVSATEVEVEGSGGAERIAATRGIIVATGGEPFTVPGLPFDGRRVIGAKEAVGLGDIPKRLAVIGGGVIGLELGTVYRKLGSEVTVIELLPTILPGIDPDLTAVAARRLRQLGVAVHTGSRAEGAEIADDGVRLHMRAADGSVQALEVDTVLVAIGMKPKTAGLGLVELGAALDERGFVRTDEACRTTVPGVYAVGDLAGQPMLAHKASFEGEVAAEAIAGKGVRTRGASIPAAVFTDPEIGTVGLTEPAAAAAGLQVKVGKFFFAASGKALALQETLGLAKVVADARTGRTLGVHIAGPHASDLLAEAALAVAEGLTIEHVGHLVHAHPTLSEVVAEAFLAADGAAIHALKR